MASWQEQLYLATLRPHGQSRHEARQPYGLELPGLVRFDLAGATGIQLVPTLPKETRHRGPNTDGGKGGSDDIANNFYDLRAELEDSCPVRIVIPVDCIRRPTAEQTRPLLLRLLIYTPTLTREGKFNILPFYIHLPVSPKVLFGFLRAAEASSVMTRWGACALTHPQGYHKTMHWALFTMEPAVADAGGVVVGDRWLADCVAVDPMHSSALLCGHFTSACSTGQLFRTKVLPVRMGPAEEAAELISRRMAGGRPMRHPTLPTVAFRPSMRQVDRFHPLLLPLALDKGEPRVLNKEFLFRVCSREKVTTTERRRDSFSPDRIIAQRIAGRRPTPEWRFGSKTVLRSGVVVSALFRFCIAGSTGGGEESSALSTEIVLPWLRLTPERECTVGVFAKFRLPSNEFINGLSRNVPRARNQQICRKSYDKQTRQRKPDRNHVTVETIRGSGNRTAHIYFEPDMTRRGDTVFAWDNGIWAHSKDLSTGPYVRGLSSRSSSPTPAPGNTPARVEIGKKGVQR
ncbi:hypothetical protein V8E54_005962 [Elaphomyces granulatus]